MGQVAILSRHVLISWTHTSYRVNRIASALRCVRSAIKTWPITIAPWIEVCLQETNSHNLMSTRSSLMLVSIKWLDSSLPWFMKLRLVLRPDVTLGFSKFLSGQKPFTKMQLYSSVKNWKCEYISSFKFISNCKFFS